MNLVLTCARCHEVFTPLVASVSGELVAPDYDRVLEQVGENLAQQLRDFHKTHALHLLREELTQ